MREDQAKQLEKTNDRVFDVLITSANPDHWIGGDAPPDELSREERGDRLWCMKIAAAALSIFTRIDNLVYTHKHREARGAALEEDEVDLDKIIRETEKESAKLIARIQSGMSKKDFLKKSNAK